VREKYPPLPYFDSNNDSVKSVQLIWNK